MREMSNKQLIRLIKRVRLKITNEEEYEALTEVIKDLEDAVAMEENKWEVTE